MASLICSLPRILLALFIVLLSPSVLAVSIEAEGSALIYNQDISSARHQALRNASQQALLQAGAYISSSQSINQGVIQTDNLRIRTLGNLSNVRVIDERVKGDRFWLRIRADVDTDQSCALGDAHTRYTKSVAVAAFPLQHRQQAALGNLYGAEQQLSASLTKLINGEGILRALNASHLSVNPAPSTAAAYQQDQGPLTEALQSFSELDVQFIVSGVIRDLSPYDPSRHDEELIWKTLYDQLDVRGRQRLRNFAVDLFIHDGYTGTLLFSRSYRTGGFWDADDVEQIGFYTPAFLKTDYGQKVRNLLTQAGRDINKQLQCEPFRSRIIRAEQNRLTFNAGSVVGIQPGDQFRLFRKAMFFDTLDQPHIKLEDTRQTVVVNEVQPRFSVANMESDAVELNIQQDDVLIAW
ncbi:flagellar assembly protein T N-terminal domain-containing protein [Motiliproteus sp.]|uniref:flagella assembly protein FlgT n=1 Tax=Motiliproteus sp. TaxID=1898955 RepID=UPI003BAD8F48